MKFKTKEYNLTYKLTELEPRKPESKEIPTLSIITDTENIRIFDIKTNDELMEDAKQQWNSFFLGDLTYFSWSNFLHSIDLFLFSGSDAYNILVQNVKDSVN